MKRIIIILFVVLTTSVFAQKKGHNIEFKIADLTNSEVVIAYHMGGKHYISDTLAVNEKGIAILKGDEPKKKGVYLCVFPSIQNKYFEFIVNEQNFSIEVASQDIQNTLSFKNSKENNLFYADMAKMQEIREIIKGLTTQKELANEKRKEVLQKEIDDTGESFKDYRIQLTEENSNLFYSELINLMRESDIPEIPRYENGEMKDSLFVWKYIKDHYWDYTNFAEEGILRTPVFHNKLITYFEKRVSQVPDSIAKACDLVLTEAAANDDVFQYVLVTLINKYANSKIMGQDGVYVYLVENYYEKGKAWWTDDEQIGKMSKRAKALKPLLVDAPAPDLTLRDTSMKVKYRLYDLPHDYTVLFVWDPDCGHCKKAMPALKSFYDKYKSKNLMVYAISTVNHEHIDEWKKFVKENNLDWINVADPYNETPFRKIYDISSTPQLYILDKNKKIVGKRIGTGQLEEFFYNYWNRNDPEKAVGMEKPVPHKHDHDGDGVPDHEDGSH